MAGEPTVYERLPGTGHEQLVPLWAKALLFFVMGIFVLLLRGKRVQLWLGPDHLLLVAWSGYREYYRRIYFRDIQSITMCRTTDGITGAVLRALIMLVFGFLAFTARSEPEILVVLLGIAGLVGLSLLIHLVRGATCAAELHTAVQTVPLISLRYLRDARKVIGRIRPKILEAQGAPAASG